MNAPAFASTLPAAALAKAAAIRLMIFDVDGLHHPEAAQGAGDQDHQDHCQAHALGVAFSAAPAHARYGARAAS